MVMVILDIVSLGSNLYLCLWLRSVYSLIGRGQSLQLIILYRALKVIHIPSLTIILESVDISWQYLDIWHLTAGGGHSIHVYNISQPLSWVCLSTDTAPPSDVCFLVIWLCGGLAWAQPPARGCDWEMVGGQPSELCTHVQWKLVLYKAHCYCCQLWHWHSSLF